MKNEKVVVTAHTLKTYTRFMDNKINKIKTDVPTKVSDLINDSGFTTFDRDYNTLDNKPKINNVELNENVTSLDLGIIEVPQVAEVGQVLAVKAVDESGKPVEWECVPNVKYQLDGTTLTISTIRG